MRRLSSDDVSGAARTPLIDRIESVRKALDLAGTTRSPHL
jgi:hypothetical protein